MSPRGERRIFFAYLAVWVTLYTLSYLALPTGDTEEAMNGNLARGLVDGLAAPHWYYQYQPWAHGPWVFGILLYPLYAIFGSAMAWVKLLAFLFALGATVVWILIAREAFGKQVAAIFAIWWLFAPPFLNQALHTAWANHMESLLVGGTFVLAFLRRKESPRATVVLLWAFWAGLAAFFCLQTVLFSIATGIAAARKWGPRPFARSLLAAPFGFAAGYLPAIVHDLQTSSHHSMVRWGDDTWHRWRNFQVAAWEVAGYDVPQVSAAFVWLALIGIAAAFGGIALRNNRYKTILRLKTPVSRDFDLFAVAYLALFAVAYSASFFWIVNPYSQYWHRYLIPLFPVLMILVCRAAGALGTVPALLVVGTLAAFSIHQHRIPGQIASVADQIRAGALVSRMLEPRGDDMQYFTEFNLVRSWEDSLDPDADLQSRICAWKKPDAAAQPTVPADQALRSVLKLPVEWRPTGFESLGRWLGPTGALEVVEPAESYGHGVIEDLAFGAGKSTMTCATAPVPFESFEAECVHAAIEQWCGLSSEACRGFVGGVAAQAWHFIVARAENPSPVSPERLAALAFGSTPGISESRVRAFAAGGIGKYCAANGWIDRERALDRWTSILGWKKSPSLARAFAHGFSRGSATRILATSRSASTNAIPVGQYTMFEDEWERRGVRLIPVSTPSPAVRFVVP